jgi:HK97 gp10 family phage protein
MPIESTSLGTITLQGDKDIIAAFKDLRMYLPKTPVRTAVRQSAQELAQKVALLAPKLTGKLAKNIVVRTHRTAKTIRARVTVNTVGKADNDQNAFYWRFLEEGFHARGVGRLIKLPFVITAFEAMKEKSAQRVIDSVGAAIDRAERKAKRAGAI